MCTLIEDDILKLVPYTHDDKTLLYQCFNNKDTQIGFNISDKESMELYFAKLPIDFYRFWAVIVHKKTDQKIGSIRLAPYESNPDLSIFLLPKYRKKGYGTKAYILGIKYCFQCLNLSEVVAGCYETNQSGRRMLEKLHFKRKPSHDLYERCAFSGSLIKQYGYSLQQQTFKHLYR